MKTGFLVLPVTVDSNLRLTKISGKKLYLMVWKNIQVQIRKDTMVKIVDFSRWYRI